ncbi:MAG: prolyl oligopeptidase family serine peptidase [Burkholderiaceae bacterium]|nr:prolyl oligopeptidase family serine peptidase [Burkholderiaceae bacterium]
MKFLTLATSAAAAAMLAACGGGGDTTDGPSFDLSGAPGSLMATPSTLTQLTPAAFQAAAPASLFQVAGVPKCTVTFNYFQYGTVGGKGEATTASAGLMVPSGADPACTGPRPVLLYAHGTTTDKKKNMASPQDGEAGLVAAMYAAQGYIVVAPNYAGYDSSTLGYHPYLNMEQQAKDMMDGLTAARKGFAAVGAVASSKLFVTGYSQGGFVSMATQRALQLAGTPVTAGAHLSGPYALGAFGDAVYAGNVNLGATVFSPLLTTSFQRTYGNIYTTPSDMYEAAFATGIETLLPTNLAQNDLFTQGKLPPAFMFEGTAPAPQFAPFFGTPNLVKTSYRNAVVADVVANPTAPKHPLRVAAQKNDLLQQNWTPAQPMLLCGGNADPTVFFALNTQGAQAYFASKGVPAQAVTVLDVDSAPTSAADPFALAKGGFAQSKAATIAAAGANAASAVAQAYHGGLVPPFCNAAARGYFSQF